MEKVKYPLLHCHDEYSNIRFLDSISKFKDILNYSKKIDLNGIALTNHETLSGSVKGLKLVKSMKEKNLLDKNFKFIIGNEIYLVDERKQRKQYHFILLAKDYQGYNLLKKLSSKAWEHSFNRGKITFVPMLKYLFKEIIETNKGHLIAQTACIGGELPQLILQLDQADKEQDLKKRQECHNKIVEFVLFCKDLFGDDFYFEIQPSNQKEQIIVNSWLKKLSSVFNIDIIITTDAHYIEKKDRPIHKAYLTSREAEREVDSFYESTYMMDSVEMYEWTSIKNVFTEEEYLKILENTNSILNKIEEYDVFKTQEIPHVDKTEELKNYIKEFKLTPEMFKKYPMLERILKEDVVNNKYWLYRIYNFLKNKNLLNDVYLSRIDLEAEELFGVTERLHSNVFDYYVTMTKLMDIAWNDAQAIVGVGRGSAGAYLSSYALEIHGIDPVKNNLPHWRHLTKERPEMPKNQYWATL